MEINVLKTDDKGVITSEPQTITGITETELQKNDKWRDFHDFIVDRTEKEITMKDGNKIRQVIFQDAEDDRGTRLNLETFSPTDDGIISKLMEGKEKIHLFYEVVTDKWGTKYKIKAIELPDGTWSAPKAKEAWKKGNTVNNRALAMQAATYLFMGQWIADNDKENEKMLTDVMKTADELYNWIKSE